MSGLKYEQIGPMSRDEAEAALSSGDYHLMARALISIGLHDMDWQWVQQQAIRFLSHRNEILVSAAILSIAHTARVNQAIDKAIVIPALKAVAAEDAKYAGRVQDALDDIRMSVK
jgi:hypothetical protein